MKRRGFIKKTTLCTTGISSGLIGAKTFEKSITGDEKNILSDIKSDSKGIRIAVVQQNANHGQVEANRKKALEFIEKALQQNADVILFHEELMVGYVENMHELAEPLEGKTTKAFQKALAGTDSIVIYGLTEKDGDDFYISAPIISEKGVVANYRKTHLWWSGKGLRDETAHFKAGNKLVTFKVKDTKCGVMICYDGDFPEVTRSYANLDCSVLFWMNNRGQRGHDEVKDLAYRNSMIISSACCCGVNEMGDTCRGGSNITGPKGELIDEIWDKEGMIISDVYPDQVSSIRENNPLFKGQHPDVYHYR